MTQRCCAMRSSTNKRQTVLTSLSIFFFVPRRPADPSCTPTSPATHSPGRKKMSFVIFGCSGIGGALARRLLARGKSVALVSRSAAKLDTFSADVASRAGGNAPLLRTAVVDVTDSAALESACAALVSSSPGGLAGLAFCVGSIPLKPIKGTSAADFLAALQLNAVAPFVALRALAPALAAGAPASAAGSVVLFSSIAARTGFPNHAAIGSAKAAVEGLTVSAAAELAPRVRVNCIAPSLTDTPLAARFVANATERAALEKAHPLPRLGNADELAALADFLLDGSSSSWITGQVFHVDGGRSTLRS